MTNEANIEDAAAAAAKPQPTKSEIVNRLLARKAGATIDELGEATKWQPHSVRAYLSGLRKKGINIAREERRDGAKSYRVIKDTAEAAKA
jgi:predicted ArsR family transcriptional regulator